MIEKVSLTSVSKKKVGKPVAGLLLQMTLKKIQFFLTTRMSLVVEEKSKCMLLHLLNYRLFIHLKS